MFSEDWKAIIWAIVILYILVALGIEYPIFGFILGVVTCAFIIWLWNIDKQTKKDNKILRQREAIALSEEEKQEKRKQKLIDKLANEFQTIIERNFKVVSAAYRKSVTSNAFGKKNYEKFAPQLEEYIRDNSKILKKLEEEFEANVQIDGMDSLIEFIERKLEEVDNELNYSDEMDPYEYEHFCASEFKKVGWDAEATQGSSDQGVDVIAIKDGAKLVAQCKKFVKPIGNKAVQEITAGMKYYDASEGIVIAPNGFTNSAEKLAKANDIKLIHHSEIKEIYN